MFSTESLLDRYHGDIDKNNWKGGIFHKINKNNQDQLSLVLEGVNQEGNVELRQYDYIEADNDKNKFLIDYHKEIISKGDAKATLSTMVGNARIVEDFNLRIEKLAEFHNNILKSPQNMDKFEKFVIRSEPTTTPSSGIPSPLLKKNSFQWACTMLHTLDDTAIDHGLWETTQKMFDGELKEASINHDLPLNVNPSFQGIENQLLEFNKEIQRLEKNKWAQNIVDHLKKLHEQLKEESHSNNNSAKSTSLHSFILKSFTDFTNQIISVHDKAIILHRVNLLSQRLDDKAEECKHVEPMSKTLKTAICGVIGAVVGFAIGATIGGAATPWVAAFGAIPGAILGAVKGSTLGLTLGLSLGGVGSIVGSSFGFFHARKKHAESGVNKSEMKPLKLAQDEVHAMQHELQSQSPKM